MVVVYDEGYVPPPLSLDSPPHTHTAATPTLAFTGKLRPPPPLSLCSTTPPFSRCWVFKFEINITFTGNISRRRHHQGFAISFSLLSLTLSSLCDRQAIKRDYSLASKVKKIVVLDGAFFVLGNVNPAAEANKISLWRKKVVTIHGRSIISQMQA
ncbi:Uridine nucleosidase 1, variant 2 [Trifolium repens]|nr:Uridine nucleosidase 1, variant 2 [Trifolium repens]